MLVLPIKKKWYDMILSGEKKEEYREIKPYYITRFRNIMGVHPSVPDYEFIDGLRKEQGGFLYKIGFRNGYSKNSPFFTAKCRLSVGMGREKWGAEKGKEYFILHTKKIA